ncbi:MAG: hypothetical protein JNK23_09205 [Opitutaceae bacterium]|nr:hypothetical protein [Opitutaceae bacterium]
MRTLRRFTSSAEALGDIAVLESQGIAPTFKGATQADSNQVIMGTVELQVAEQDYEVAEKLLLTADRESAESHSTPEKRKRTPARYAKIALIAFVAAAALLAYKTTYLSGGPMGYFMLSLVAGGIAVMTGLFFALLDL